MTNDSATPKSFKAIQQRRSPEQRAKDNPKNLKLAIAAYCFMCKTHDGVGPHSTKAQVRDCAEKTCPLWPHRGWQTATTGKTSLPPEN